jgi:hypothetical protein
MMTLIVVIAMEIDAWHVLILMSTTMADVSNQKNQSIVVSNIVIKLHV